MVERMFDAYCERQSANHVAKVTGVARATAKRYIEQGDPGRAIEPLEVRFARMTRTSARIKEKRVVYSNASAQAALQNQLKDLDELISFAAQQLRKNMKKQVIRLSDVAKAIQIRNDVVQRMKPFGEVEQETEITQAQFEGKTAQELDFFATYGQWPTPEQLAHIKQHRHAIDTDGRAVDTTDDGAQKSSAPRTDTPTDTSTDAPTDSPNLTDTDTPPGDETPPEGTPGTDRQTDATQGGSGGSGGSDEQGGAVAAQGIGGTRDGTGPELGAEAVAVGSGEPGFSDGADPGDGVRAIDEAEGTDSLDAFLRGRR
jgi:hypothetical protein